MLVNFRIRTLDILRMFERRDMFIWETPGFIPRYPIPKCKPPQNTLRGRRKTVRAVARSAPKPWQR